MSKFDFSKVGMRQSTDMEIMKGSAPYIFDMFVHDSFDCKKYKANYNYAAASVFETNKNVFSQGELVMSQINDSITIKSSLNGIAKHCLPSDYKL